MHCSWDSNINKAVQEHSLEIQHLALVVRRTVKQDATAYLKPGFKYLDI